MNIGGDSQNTTPVAIQGGLQAGKLAKPMLEAAKQEGFKKLPWDQFVSTVKDQTAKNIPIADAMQSQSIFTRFAAKIPFVRNFLGPDQVLNSAIGSVGKKAMGSLNAADVTRIMFDNSLDDVAKKAALQAGGVADDAIANLMKASAERAASAGAQTVAQQGATAVAQNISDDLVNQAVQSGLRKTAKDVTAESIKKIMQSGLEGPALRKALMDHGVLAKTADGLIKSAAESGAKTATQAAATTGTQEAAKGGLKGFFGKLLSGAKGNFVISGIFSLGSNAIQLATGKMNFKQFVGLTLMDTGAYGVIGLASGAAGGAIAGAIGQALIPIPGLGFICGLAIGMLGGLLYEKFLRNPVKNMLGPSGGGAPAYNPQEPVTPGQTYQDPYANQAPAPGYSDPYAQQPAAPAQPAAPNPNGMSYEDALAYLNQ